ncbi:MAG: hypothetical protein ACYC3L_00270 [Gemmatimonadaceae bacterium]
MKMFRSVVVLALCGLPVALAAQGGMGGMGGGRRGGMGGGMGGGRGGMGGRPGAGTRAAPKFPTAKSLEELNPAALLVDKHKKLKLADSTVAALEALKQRIFERNADLMATYDSLQRAYRPPSLSPREAQGAAPDTTRREAFVEMQQLRRTLDQLSQRRKTDMQESLALVPDDRKEEAAKLLDKQDGKFTGLMPVMPTRGAAGPDADGRRRRPDVPPPR